MPFVPTIKLYQSNGSTPVYTFEHVLDLPNLMTDSPDYVELNNKRSAGSIVIAGGNKAYDFNIRGILTASDYTALVSAMSSLRSTIISNTKYVLKIDTSISTTENINVMRLSPIQWEGPERKTNIQYYTIIFRALSWS